MDITSSILISTLPLYNLNNFTVVFIFYDFNSCTKSISISNHFSELATLGHINFGGGSYEASLKVALYGNEISFGEIKNKYGGEIEYYSNETKRNDRICVFLALGVPCIDTSNQSISTSGLSTGISYVTIGT